MKTTNEFLDAVKAVRGLTSDYQLSKHLGCTHSVISGYRHGKSRFDESTACKIAEELGLEPGYVLACIASERAQKEEVKKAWARVADLLSGVTVALVFTVIMTAHYSDHQAAPLLALAGFTDSTSIYIMRNWNLTELVVFFLFIIACIIAYPRHNHPKK